MRHNEIRDELLYLSQHDLTLVYVRAKPIIYQGCTISKKEIRQGSDKDKETRGGVMVQCLRYHQVDAIIDVRFGDADEDMYKYEPMEELLDRW